MHRVKDPQVALFAPLVLTVTWKVQEHVHLVQLERVPVKSDKEAILRVNHAHLELTHQVQHNLVAQLVLLEHIP